MKASPTLVVSLIIATRERAKTLAYTLSTAISQQSQEFEIVVSDNVSQDDTRTVVEGFRDPRVRYFLAPSRLSMCGNYEFALSHARGRYVIFIGDDDAVMPHGLDQLIDILNTTSEPTVHMWPLHVYDWPAEGRGAKVAHLAPGFSPRVLDLKPKALAVVAKGGWKHYELPSPYHCAIPRSILDSIRDRTGKVFHSTQPDVFTAMAIPVFADRAINLGFTVTLNGRSARSNGLGFVSKSARANIERFISEYGDYKFHPSLYPGIPGMANMIPDAVLIARDLFPELYRNTRFSYDWMWAYVCRLGFVSRSDVFREIGSIRKYHPLNIPRFLAYSLIQQVGAVRRIFLDRWTGSNEVKDHPQENIFDFVTALDAKVDRYHR